MAESTGRPFGFIVALVVGVAAVAGSSRHGPSRSEGPPTGKPATGAPETKPGDDKKSGSAAADSKSALPDRDYCKPYLDFRRRAGVVPESPAVTKDLGELIADDARRNQVVPQFLIVTLPDPVDSRFGYRFDALIDAVQMAAESPVAKKGAERRTDAPPSWTLDSFWMPWQPSGVEPTSHEVLKPVVDPARKAPLHELDPGIMIFRKSREEDGTWPVLILLLVGERPTSGISKRPLYKSFDVIHDYYKTLVGPPMNGRPVIRIVGPSFTGSEYSLAHTIRSWSKQHPQYRYHVRSGSANRIDKKRFEIDAGGHPWPDGLVRFDATLIHFDTVLEGLFRFLRKVNGFRPLGKIGLLTESDTEFGKSISKNKVDRWLNEQKSTLSPGPDAIVTTMKFPFHISQVAIAYDQEKRKDSRNNPTLIRPSSRLAIPFDETGSPRDIVPSLSPDMSTAISELVLAKILETISIEDFRYIGIVASDTRDIIFLAGMIRQFCPDVQLFCASGDLMLGHPLYSSELRGTIVATSYPLFSLAQRWDPPYEGDRRRHLFSNEGDQGTFNATLSLLHEEETPESDYYESLFDYGMPFDELGDLKLLAELPRLSGGMIPLKPRQEHPVLWFSVVGQRGFWPVEYRDVGDPAGQSGWLVNVDHAPGPITRDQLIDQFVPLIPQFTWQWGTLFLGLSGAAWYVFMLIGLHAAAPALANSLPGGRLLEYAGPPSDGSRPPARWRSVVGQGGREIYVLLALVTFSASYAYICTYPCLIAVLDSPLVLFARRDLWPRTHPIDRWNLRFGWLASWFSLTTFVALLLATARRLLRGLNQDRDRSNGLWDYLCSKSRFLRVGTSYLRTWPGWSWVLVDAVALAIGGLLPALWAFSIFHAWWSWSGDYPERFHSLLDFERLVDLGDGVSPVVPLLLLVLVLGALIWCQLSRLDLVRRQWTPFIGVAPTEHLEQRPATATALEKNAQAYQPSAGLLVHRLQALRLATERVERLLRSPFPWNPLREPSALIILGVSTIVLFRLWQSSIPTIDFAGGRLSIATPFGPVPIPYLTGHKVVITAVWLVILSILVAICRFLRLWGEIAALTGEFVQMPMLRAYDRIPPIYWRCFGRYLDRPHGSALGLTIALQQWAVVARAFDRVSPQLSRLCSDETSACEGTLIKGPDFESIKGAVRNPPDPSALASAVPGSESLRATRAAIGSASLACLDLLDTYWQSSPPADGYSGPPKTEEPHPPAPADPQAAADQEFRQWLRQAEDLVALEVVAFVNQANMHLRNLATYLAIATIPLIIAVSSYPFQPQRFLMVCLWTVLLAVAGGVLWVYVQMERNEFLSRISQTTPGHITLDRTFLTNVLTFILPLVGFALAQFPFFSDTLNQWLEPLTRVLR